MVGHNDLCDQPFPAQSTLVSSRGEQETPNAIAALIQQGCMNLSQAAMSQVCSSPKKPICPKNGPSCSSGRCGHTGWKAKEAIPPLTIQLHLVLASKIPHMCWFGSTLCCVYVLRTAVRVITAAGMHLTTRLLPPLKADVNLSLRLSITYSMSRTCTGLQYGAYVSPQTKLNSLYGWSQWTDCRWFHEIWGLS